tara:strand:+ start:118 stop:546 length:429 start_codon:yes stop_codon:yes gene_type:complete
MSLELLVFFFGGQSEWITVSQKEKGLETGLLSWCPRISNTIRRLPEENFQGFQPLGVPWRDLKTFDDLMKQSPIRARLFRSDFLALKDFGSAWSEQLTLFQTGESIFPIEADIINGSAQQRYNFLIECCFSRQFVSLCIMRW